MKKLKHDGCGGTVNRRTLICARCQTRPAGNKISYSQSKPRTTPYVRPTWGHAQPEAKTAAPVPVGGLYEVWEPGLK